MKPDKQTTLEPVQMGWQTFAGIGSRVLFASSAGLTRRSVIIMKKYQYKKRGGFLSDVGYLCSHWFDYSTEEWRVINFDKSFWTL
jgi:hypothetical protein